MFLKYAAINCRFCGPVARQPALPWQPVCAPLVGGIMLAPNYEVDRLTHYWVIAIFNWIRYVTLWPWIFDLLTLESRHVMSLGWSISVPRLRCIRLTVPELWRLLAKRFLTIKGSNFQFRLSNSQKALPWRERRIMSIVCGDVSKDATCGCDEERKKGQKVRNFHALHWHIAQTSHVDVAPWNFACGVVYGKYLYISNFMKIGRGVLELWKVENSPLPLTRPMPYTTVP